MKSLKRTLAAIAALTIASMGTATVAFATETEAATTEAASTEAVTTVSTDAPASTAAGETTAAATTASTEAATEAAGTAANANPDAAVQITVETKTAKPGDTVDLAVSISGNKALNSTGLKYTYDSRLGFEGKKSVHSGLIEGPTVVKDGTTVAITSAVDNAGTITEDGVLYTLTFTVPEDAKAGDFFYVSLDKIDTLKAYGSNDNIVAGNVSGGIKIADEEVTTAATEASKGAATTAQAAAKTTTVKAGSSPATGEALPIAGAVAAVAVIGGVAVASRKRK